ncbi:DUF4190 domain-containing protein [Cellulomonas shaoxiangyii]|uniref:DUF4190 domain-containing protein n=1 Tax=Cellulomonas shaoxiangyii TaxID=2566013 RepID=A0A4P7SI99_9CELL|nr:DUF4190 domain-containing protein [Cellulomonas shaoxiangyii]QCB93471.1 DUF4190 domain-containing protein [Cellulomonas shaoxiangyii]TGY86793.1 DUF4190 domain-containing protein [Cellulomonas shaoxiangyii]
MSHPADPGGRPADGPSYGHEAPYGPPPGRDEAGPAPAAGTGGTPADPSTGSSSPAGAAYPPPGGAYPPPGGAYPPPGGAYPSAGGAYPAPGAAYGTPGAQAAGAAGSYAQPYPYAGPGYWPRNDLGVWSLVLGIAGLVLACGFFTGIPAVIVGMNARKAIARGEANNDGMVTAGIVLGWVSIAFGVLMVALFLLSFIIPLVFLGMTLPWAASSSYAWS